MAEFGHKVVVVTSKNKFDKKKKQKKEGFLLYRFKAFNLPELKILPQISSLGFMPGAILELPKLIKKHKIQLIHAEGRFFPITFFSVLLNRIVFKKPMFISIQGRLKGGITGLIEKIYDKIVIKHLFRNITKLICVSKSLKRHFIKFKIPTKLLTVIPNGVDTSIFTKVEYPKFLDYYLMDKEDYKKVIFVGRLDTQKGVEYLLHAIPTVIRNFPKVHFFILGNGSLETKLKKLAKKLHIQANTTFIDMIPLEKMPEFYSSADILCLPSIHAGFPLSIVEALSIGLVIVASETEGIPEAIIENKNGFLVEPKNVIQLTEKLLKALNLQDDEISQIQKNNIELAQNKYSWNFIVRQIEELYKNKKN